MNTVFAVATHAQGAALTAAAVAAAAVLVLREPRARAIAMISALVLAGAAMAALKAHTVSRGISGHPALVGAAVVAGLAVLAILVELIRRRPEAFALLAFAALPFRVPVPVGGDNANLLLPLYGVIAAGALAYAIRWWRAGERDHAPAPGDGPRALRRVELALAVVLVLYAVQSTYSSDINQASVAVCFFYVPFAVLFRLLLDVPWSQRLLRQVFGLVVALALLFAAVGFVEAATGRLLISNAKVLEANEIKPYFRVNSLFFDPNIYGRFLALTMIVLAASLPSLRRGRQVAAVAAALAVLWAGMVLSLSQSSFAALLVGLLVLGALRWRAIVVGGCVAAALAVALAVVLIAPGQVGLNINSRQALDRATSGRTDLIRGGVRMARDRPLWGFGSGSFADRFRKRERVHSEKSAAVSHTIPVTVAAEQGAIGLVAYVALLLAAFMLLFGGLRRAVRAGPPAEGVALAAIAAVYSLVYAAFLEDPLSWTLLALGASLRLAAERGGDEPQSAPRASQEVVAA
jgi:putative inorganic carbon (HCO3(-)) transporter